MKHVSAQNLECPICLNIFNDPKILSCNQTFCKGCITLLLESQADNLLPCPVCRGVTDVPNGNADELQSNIALRSLIDEVQSQQQICTNCDPQGATEATYYCQECGKYLCIPCHQAHSQWKEFSVHQIYSMKDVLTGKVSLKRRRKCKKHPVEDEEFFCSNCRMYVCFRCRTIYRHEREGHAIIEASEHEYIQGKRVEKIEAKAEEKVASIAKYIEFVAGERIELRGIAKKLDESVLSAYEETLKQLTTRKDLLREEIKRKFAVLEQNFDRLMETSRQQIKNINAVKELVGGGRKVPLEKAALTVHDTLCEDLKELLGKADPDYDKTRKLKKSGQKILFERNKGEDELELGRFEEVDWRCRDMALSKKDSMHGMASTQDGRMAVCSHLGGVEVFTSDDQVRQTVLNDVKLRHVGYLSDGRYVVRNTNNVVNLYTIQCEKLDVTFKTLNHDEGGFGGLTVGSEDQIFMSYTKAKTIQVFHPKGGTAVREIQCDGYEPWQIFAMPTCKRFVISDNKWVKLIDEFGVVKSEATKGPALHSFPAVCHDDSIIIAWVKHNEELVTIDRYDSELNHVATLITEYSIQKPEKRNWYYLQEFGSGELAFCSPDRLYIFY